MNVRICEYDYTIVVQERQLTSYTIRYGTKGRMMDDCGKGKSNHCIVPYSMWREERGWERGEERGEERGCK